jgi:hypothetical protein
MQLRDYQKRIVEQGTQILTRFNLLYLAMQTRTGKTLTSLHICNNYKNVLFVTKKKAIKSIENDYNSCKFNFKLTVINYESVHKITDNFDIIVCDEAHAIGQFPKPNNRCRAIKELSKNKPIIYLSATPCPESWAQLYHQFWISSFSPFLAFNNFYRWADIYVTKTIKYLYNREINDYSNANNKLIWQKIKHLFITQTQVESGFNITVTEKILTVPMPENIKQIINNIMKENIHNIGNDVILADTAVKVMQKVHQLSSGTVIAENEQYLIIDTFKADFVKKYFAGQKIAIFYKFKSEFEMLKACFDNWTSDAFEFQNDPLKVFLGQFISSREGIRLDAAKSIVFFNIDFSYLSYEQARNRIASFERETPAKLYWLFSDKGIEKRIYKAVKNKMDYTLKIYNNERNDIRASLEQASS